MTDEKQKDMETEEWEEDAEEEDRIVLTLDDDSELECTVLDIFPFQDKEYIALLPEAEDEEDEGILVYEYTESDDGESIELTQIESDEEYNAVADEFDRILSESIDEEDSCECGHDHTQDEE